MAGYKVCPICNAGELIPEHYENVISYKNFRAQIDCFEHSICSCCETSLTSAEQARVNKLIIIDYRRVIDGLLPSTEIRRIRKKLKLNVKDASKVIGGGGVAFSKYESGVVNQSLAVDNLLRLLDENPSLIRSLSAYRNQREVSASTNVEVFIRFGESKKVAYSPPVQVLDFLERFSDTVVTTFERVVYGFTQMHDSAPSPLKKVESSQFISLGAQ